MKLIAQIILNLSLLTSLLYSQNLQWQAVYNGPADSTDLAQKILLDPTGNVIVTGSSVGTGTTYDFATIKYNQAGVQQWAARYNGPANGKDYGISGAIDGSGNIYVCGNSFTNNVMDICLIKYNNSNGTGMWNSRYPAASVTGYYSLTADNNGNCYIAGVQNSNLIVIKYNTSGAQQWVATYNGPANGYDEGRQILVDAAGNVYAAGISDGGSTQDDIVLIKYNSSGVQQWATRFNISAFNKDDSPTALKMDEQGNLYISGYSYNNNTNSQPVLLVCKFNSSGVLQWSQTISSQISFAMGNDMAIDDFNSVYITGSIVNTANKETMLIAKYNTNGIQQWVNYYSRTSSSDDCGYRISIDRHNYIYIQNHSKTGGSNNYRVILKYNSNGNQIWTNAYQGNIQGTESANNSSLVVDNNFNVYSTGGNLGNSQSENYITLKYTQSCYTVSGLITYQDNNQPVNGGSIKALYYDRSSASIIVLDSTGIQSNGAYTLNCNHQDSAYFMVYQDDEEMSFVPTYYPSTIDWQQASRVFVDHNLSNINVQVYRINNTTASYSISGTAVNNFQVPNYIQDAIVYAKIGNDYKNFAISNADGSYSVTTLPSGNYTLTTYRMGYNSVTQNVSITNSNLTGVTINFSNPIAVKSISKIVPEDYMLSQNYPNPFNPSTKITFAIPVKEYVTLAVYDMTGREAAVLINNEMEAGYHDITFNASQLSSGVYFYKLTTKNTQLTKKMVLVK
ncbi:MAG: T9SS C-terminal target domain-containing protein [Ignavibacteriae bacterium]|nr:MAG: T9SS C-terminal target domain-containing protein [Ignavibacteriota bacterium]